MVNAEFDEFAKTYADIVAKELTFFDGNYSYFPRYRANLVKEFAGGGVKSILDYGCGIGLGIGPLREVFPNCRIVGCDPSTDSLELAKIREPGCEFSELTSIQSTPQFDVITAISVFHHIEPRDRYNALRYCFDRLNPGGRLVVFEHNPFNPVTRRIVSRCPVDVGAILLTRKETIRRVQDAGFNRIESGYFLIFPEFLKVLRSLEDYLRMLPLGGQFFVVAERA